VAEPTEHRVPLKDNVILRTVVYYAVLFGVNAWLQRFPRYKAAMQGSFESLISTGGFAAVSKSAAAAAPAVSIDETTLTLTVAAAMTAAVLLALPVCWVYALTRRKRGYQQSVVQTLMLLPPLVSGVTVIVKYSLPLAFALAGIVAAVRFRNTLEDSKDAVYIFLATAIGLAAAVQLPVAAVISVIFNLIVLAIWYTDFGKAPTFQGAKAKQSLEDAQAAMKQTGSFVALVDNEILENMTPQQLELVADRAWRRRRRLETDTPEEDEMQRRDVLLRLRTYDPEGSRIAVEDLFDEFLKKWRLGGVVHEKDGTHVVEYAVQMKKSVSSTEFLDALNAKSQVIGAEIK
jgi:uncharacterized protein DUF4956